MTALEKYKLLISELQTKFNNKKVLLACSTGVDSMVLLKALEDANINFGVAHVNHSKREQSNIEEKFIKEYCCVEKIQFHFIKLEQYNGSNFQSWARSKRIEFLKEIAETFNYDYVLTAHHLDDNLETTIMRFFKKSSLRGLSGIEIETNLGDTQIRLYRPLLKLTKEDIYTIAEKLSLKFFEDASNQEDDYDRNKIRHNLIPQLRSFNENIYDCLEQYCYNLNETSKIIEDIVNKFISNQITTYNHNSYKIYKFSFNEFKKEYPYIQKEIIFTLLKDFELSIKTIDEILSNLEKNKYIREISDNGIIIKEYDYIKIIIGKYESNVNLKIEKEGIYHLNNEITVKVLLNSINNNELMCKLWYNIETIRVDHFPITITNWVNGDKAKFNSGTVKISNLLTNKKVNYIDRLYTYCVKENNEINHVLIYNQER